MLISIASVVHTLKRVPETVLATTSPPAGFTLRRVQQVSIDGAPAYHLRFVPARITYPTLGGEHYSALVTPDGILKGETRMDARLSEERSQAPLPTEDEARASAWRYLAERAPDLAAAGEVHWVAPHAEKVLLTANAVAGGLSVTVTGMKVKCRNTADGRWFWVIVGPGEQIITFERDVVWNTSLGMRRTEMWLHDLWLIYRGEDCTSSI
jgi:hypothetical protein